MFKKVFSVIGESIHTKTNLTIGFLWLVTKSKKLNLVLIAFFKKCFFNAKLVYEVGMNSFYKILVSSFLVVHIKHVVCGI